jgi:hypothetical protein
MATTPKSGAPISKVWTDEIMGGDAASKAGVYEAEWKDIEERRSRNFPNSGDRGKAILDAIEKSKAIGAAKIELNDGKTKVEDIKSGSPKTANSVHELGHIGLAFSGGGIRSATFNVGVLEALHKNGWLPLIDYLSTVSGGGYIGSAYSAYMSKSANEHADFPFKSPPGGHESGAMVHLRAFANYLAPRGAFDKIKMLTSAFMGMCWNFLLILCWVAAFAFIGLLFSGPKISCNISQNKDSYYCADINGLPLQPESIMSNIFDNPWSLIAAFVISFTVITLVYRTACETRFIVPALVLNLRLQTKRGFSRFSIID